jgi:uncharacterized membrane protein YdjX (TVP38/TMEM64 family)
MAAIRIRLLLRGLLLMATLAALAWGLKALGLAHLLDVGWIDAEVRDRGASGRLLFVAVGTVAVAVGMPRQAVCFLAGYAFGPGPGTALATVASLAGCVVCFLYARLLGRGLVLHRFSERVRRLDGFLRDNPLTMTMLVRFLPVGSNLLTNLVAGVSAVRLLPFAAGTLIGYLPQTIVFALLGSGIQVQSLWLTTMSIVLFVLSALLGVFLYRRLRHGHSLGDDADDL